MEVQWRSREDGAPSMFSMLLLPQGPVLKGAQIERCKHILGSSDGGGSLEVESVEWELVDDEYDGGSCALQCAHAPIPASDAGVTTDNRVWAPAAQPHCIYYWERY